MTIQEKEKLFNKIMEMLSPIVFNKLMNIIESEVQSAEEGFSFKNKNSVIKFDPNLKNGYADKLNLNVNNMNWYYNWRTTDIDY